MSEGNLFNEIRKVEDRLDNHIKIYKANGEAVRENNRLIKNLHDALDTHIQEEAERAEKLQPMLDLLTTMTFGKKLLVGIATVTAAVGTIALFIKGLR